MLASDIFDEAKEVLSNNNPALVFRAMTRAVELLAPTGLFDPFAAYLDFSVQDTHFVALPRDVKSVIRININNNPSFGRGRIFEFAQNTDGTVEGPEVGWSWADRGTLPIQDEFHLPGKLNALATSATDNDKTVTVTGKDIDGRVRKETLTLHHEDPPEGEIVFHVIDSVVRDETEMEVLLRVGENLIARYYPDEREPRYRVIKLSQTNVACRMYYRRTAYKIGSLDDIIPIDSSMGMLMMIDAVNLFWKKEYAAAKVAQEAAVEFVKQEQASRQDGVDIAIATEGQTASNQNINTLDSIIAADVYDEASQIFGPIGRAKLFDRITDAVEALSRKGHWDSQIGFVDIWKLASVTESGLFALPRFVETPLSINVNGQPGFARNGWFEFHLNGPGETCTASCGTWDDIGNTPVIGFFPKDNEGKPIAQRLVALPDDPQDNNTQIRVFGWDSSGNRIRVAGADGFLVPCVAGEFIPNPDAPAIARIDRIEKQVSRGKIRLVTVKTYVITPAVPAIPEEVTYSNAEGAVLTVIDPTFSEESLSIDFIIDMAPETGFATGNAHGSLEYNGDLVVPPGGDMAFTPTFGTPKFRVSNYGTSSATLTFTRQVTPAVPGVAAVLGYESDILLGHYDPDETVPTYRLIKLPTHSATRIRVKYRRRAMKVDSMFTPLHLRSRLAIEAMMRALKMEKEDVQSAALHEMNALKYLKDEQAVGRAPTGFTLQFDSSTMPGVTGFENFD